MFPKVEPINVNSYRVQPTSYEAVGKLPVHSIILDLSDYGKGRFSEIWFSYIYNDIAPRAQSLPASIGARTVPHLAAPTQLRVHHRIIVDLRAPTLLLMFASNAGI